MHYSRRRFVAAAWLAAFAAATLGHTSAKADDFAYEATGIGTNLFGVVDLNSGEFTPRGGMGQTVAGLGSYGGTIYGGAYHGNTLYSIDTSTGTLTAIGNSNISYGVFGSTRTGLFAFGDNGVLYSIDPATGAASSIGSTGLSFGGNVMGMSTGSDTLYLTQNLSLYSLSTQDGSASLIGTINTSELGFGALVDIGGTLYGGAYNGSTPNIYTLDSQTGGASFVAASPSTPSGITVAGFWGLAPIEPVPGPIAGAGLPGLLLMSTGLLGWWRRRQSVHCNSPHSN
jgi:hypothetical protein